MSTLDPQPLPRLGRRSLLAGAAGAAGAAFVGACTSDSDTPASSDSTGATSTGASSTSPSTATGGAGDLATTDEIHDWIREIVEQGVRRPGYDADVWAEQFLVEQFEAFGLTDVHLEPVELTRWEPLEWSLEATPAGGEPRTLECFPLPYSPATEPIELDLVAFDLADPSAVAGRAALYDNVILHLPATDFAGSGSAPDDLTERIYDPDGTLDDTPHVVPFGLALTGVADAVADAGGAAFIGSLVDYPGDGHRYYVPYTGEPGAVPGVWISGSDGAWLHEQLAAGPVRVRLEVQSTAEPFTSHNVVGDLAGASDEVVIVATHHDAPWASAVEDASGMALLLAQARYWAAVPEADRPHRLRFLAQGGHMCGGAGLHRYIDDHRDELARVVLEVHLEHAALDVDERDGELVAADRCTPRWFFTSRIPQLEATVWSALVDNDLARSMILAPDAIGARPPTDGAYYHDEGVPIVHFLAAPAYLFDEADTLDKIDRDALVPLTRATIAIVASTAGVTADALRAAVVP